MKKTLVSLIALALVFCLAACSGGASDEPTTLDLAAISSAIEGGGLFLDTLEAKSQDRIADAAGLDISECKYAEYHLGAGYTGEEWGVFECNTVDGAKALVKQLETRNADQIKLYESYAPDAVPRIKNAVLERAGQYVIYVVAENADAAKTLVSSLIK